MRNFCFASYGSYCSIWLCPAVDFAVIFLREKYVTETDYEDISDETLKTIILASRKLISRTCM